MAEPPVVIREAPPPLTVREHVDVVGWSPLTTVMFIACGAYWMADALELGLMSYLVPVLEDVWTLEKNVSDAIASIVFSGIVCGSLAFGLLGDRYGRRVVFTITAAGTGIFGIASAFSPNLAVMLVLRFGCGVFLGGGPSAYSYYLEFVPRAKHFVMTFFNLWFTLGSVLEAVLAYLVLPSAALGGPAVSWRYLIAFSSAPILLLSLAFPLIRESPQWLVSADKTEQVTSLVDRMYAQMRKRRTAEIVMAPETHRGRLWTLFERLYVRRTLLFCAIWFATNLVYYGSVFFATAYFLRVLQPSDKESQGLLILIIVAMGEVLGAIFSAVMISRGVRRAVSCSIQFSVCALFLLLMLVTDNVYARASFAFVSRAAVFGSFATVYLWTPLVIPAHLRTSAMGLVSSFGKIASICAPFISSAFDKNSVLVPSVLYGSMSLVAAVLVLMVGVEPEANATTEEPQRQKLASDDETAALLKH